MRDPKVTIALCAALLCGSASAALAQSSSDADKHFVRDAIEGGNSEVELGRLAQQKSNSDDIKEFGQKMVGDHTKLGDQMHSVAGKIGVQPPAGTSASGKVLKAKLEVLSGDAFDKAYIKGMVKDHREDLKAFQDEAANGMNQDVKDAAKQGAEVVQMHLQMAEQIAKSHNVDVDK